MNNSFKLIESGAQSGIDVVLKMVCDKYLLKFIWISKNEGYDDFFSDTYILSRKGTEKLLALLNCSDTDDLAKKLDERFNPHIEEIPDDNQPYSYNHEWDKCPANIYWWSIKRFLDENNILYAIERYRDLGYEDKAPTTSSHWPEEMKDDFYEEYQVKLNITKPKREREPEPEPQPEPRINAKEEC